MIDECMTISLKGEWKALRQRPIARLPYGEPSSIFVLLPFPQSGAVQGVLGATLNFKVREGRKMEIEGSNDVVGERRGSIHWRTRI